MKESAIEQKVIRWARENGWLVLKLNITSNRGWPDCLFLSHGVAVFIEFKQPGERPRLLQEYRHAQLRTQGFKVEVFSDPLKAIEWLKKL